MKHARVAAVKHIVIVVVQKSVPAVQENHLNSVAAPRKAIN